MPVRAVLFDPGGTLFSYRCTAARFDALLVALARRHGVDAPPGELRTGYREAMARICELLGVCELPQLGVCEPLDVCEQPLLGVCELPLGVVG